MQIVIVVVETIVTIRAGQLRSVVSLKSPARLTSVVFFTRYASVNSTCAQPPPPGNRGAFASLVSPGGGALANLARPGGRALANPGGTPGLLTRTLLTLKRGQHGEFPR